ncbi:MAG: nucleotide exchange factor GrpE [Bacteroidetes bacterium]|nr:nucleotide exchange factor GrpE [Bacteroidota bacterium]
MEEEINKQETGDNPETPEITSQEQSEEGKKGKKFKFRKESKEEELQQKADEINDKYLRLFAEFDNYRKRTIKEKSEILAYASEELIVALLPVLDDFERALQSFDTSDETKVIREGVELIYNKLRSLLESKGLNALSSIGSDFNTDYHEAITSISAAPEMKGKVVDEVQKGYGYKGKVIRYAKVIVGS